MAKIAFFGLGNMGGPMAVNLLAAGHKLSVYDPFVKTLDKFTNDKVTFDKDKITVAETPASAVADAEYIVSMLPTGKHVVDLYVGNEQTPGIIQHINKSALIIDSSTIDVDSVKSVHTYAQQHGIEMLDAPVSGGVSAAQAGTLTFMCGASQENFERAKTVLSGMGKNVFLAGDTGAGQIAKMCNNMLLAVHMAGTAESLKLGINNGLDPAVLSQIMLQSSGSNWSLEKYNPAPGVMENAPASHDFKPGFTVELMLKDLGLALQNSVSTKSSVPMGALARNLYASYGSQDDANAKLDFSSIWKMF